MDLSNYFCCRIEESHLVLSFKYFWSFLLKNYKALMLFPSIIRKNSRWVFDDKGQFSSVLHKNICYGYSLALPCHDDFVEYPYPVF